VAASGAAKAPQFQPVRPLGCEPIAGSVKFRTWPIDARCRSLASKHVPRDSVGADLQVGILVAGSAEGFRGALGCEPPPAVDFSTQRLVTYSFVHDSNRVYSLAGVVRKGGELHLVFDIRKVCQGIPPEAQRTVRLIAIPPGTEPIRVAFCNHRTSCGPVP
jgi:hypothetical protein